MKPEVQEALSVYREVEEVASHAAALQRGPDGRPALVSHPPHIGLCSRPVVLRAVGVAVVEEGLSRLPTWELQRIADRADQIAPALKEDPRSMKAACPLFEGRRCLIEKYRPLLCRTLWAHDGGRPGRNAVVGLPFVQLDARRAESKAVEMSEPPEVLTSDGRRVSNLPIDLRGVIGGMATAAMTRAMA